MIMITIPAWVVILAAVLFAGTFVAKAILTKYEAEGGGMSDFTDHLLKQAEKREAYEKYNFAGQLLENRQIKERLAEIKSQVDPLDKLINKIMPERDRCYAAAFYVVLGRLPSEPRDD